MIRTVSEYEFRDEMIKSFSYNGATALYNYLEEWELGSSQHVEFDPVAIRCDFSEYESLDEIKENYIDIKTMEDLQDNTTVIEFDGGIIIQNY